MPHPVSRSSKSRPQKKRVISILLAAGLLLGGCSSAGDDAAASATPQPAPDPPATSQPSPGTVTLDVSGVTDATNLVMLALIGKDVPIQAMAAACDIVRADPFSFTGAYLPITGGDPCTLGAEPVLFEPGSYEVIVAVLPGGARTPHQCTQTSVTVDGDVTIELAGLGPPADCDF